MPLPKTGDPYWHEDDYPKYHVIVADDAYQLLSYMMKPYSSRQLSEEHVVFNNRLSRLCRVSENAFGILASRFRIFPSMINMKNASSIDTVLLDGGYA